MEVFNGLIGLITDEPTERLFTTPHCTATGFPQAMPKTPFRILVEKFARHTVKHKDGKTISISSRHPTAIADANISYSELLGLITDNTHYKKWQIYLKDINTINQHLADNREYHTGKDETLDTADTIELAVDEKYNPRISKMLKRRGLMFRTAR